MAAEVVLTWRDEGVTLVGVLVVAVEPEEDNNILEEDENMAL